MRNMDKFTEVSAFLHMEADLLDQMQYDDWLKLWTDDGLYIVPVDHTKTDYKNNLNIAYDDARMRQMRVTRLQSGRSVSVRDMDGTVRTVSRLHIVDANDSEVIARYAYCLYECKQGRVKQFPGIVQFKLRYENGEYKIQEKLVKLMNSDRHLSTIGFIF